MAGDVKSYFVKYQPLDEAELAEIHKVHQLFITSCRGIFRNSLTWNLSDGTEDTYNRSFVGFTPEGQAPMEHLKTMLDWNKVLLKK